MLSRVLLMITPKLKKAADIIKRNATHSKNIVGNILSFSRFEDEEVEALNIKETVDEALNFVSDILPRTISVNRHGFNNFSTVKCMATERGMMHILTNLIINAAQAMNHQGIIDITLGTQLLNKEKAQSLELQEDQKYCVIQIADTGIGIPEKIISKIFDPFFTTKQTGEGTG